MTISTKNLLTKALMLLAVFGMIGFSGCEDDEDPARDKFLGSYTTNETCDGTGTSQYTLTITASANNENDILLTVAGGDPILSTVSGDRLTFNTTVNGDQFEGNGTLSGSTLTLIYSATNTFGVNSCNATGIKQ